MDRMIFTAMNAAKQIMLQQTSNSHNLANVNTTGFKADLDVFKDKPVYGPGYASRVYAEDQRAGIDFSPGTMRQTGRDLDIAINGDGYIAVQAADGSEAYTRAGDLRINSAGLLETGSGELVLGNGGPVAIPPFQTFEVGADGTISVQPLGQTAATLAVVDRIKLVASPEGGMQKRNDGLFNTADGAALPADATIRVVGGVLESSNVNAIDALVNMIQLARNFEMTVKLMEQTENTDRASASLMELGA